MKLLVTGSNGFVGRNIVPLLRGRYTIYTLARSSADFQFDLSGGVPEFQIDFDAVLHAAGKAHTVPKTPEEKAAFHAVNYEGTVNLCAALAKSPPKHFIFLSTVAVYGADIGIDIAEDAPLAGSTPYAESKIKAEHFLQGWCAKYGCNLTILRPSLIAGPDAPGNLGAMVEAIKSGKYFNIGRGVARKSVVWVEDFAEITDLIIKKNNQGIFNVTDNRHPQFSQIASRYASIFHRPKPRNLPIFMAKLTGMLGDILGEKFPLNTGKVKKIISPLTFSNQKIKSELGWTPTDVISKI